MEVDEDNGLDAMVSPSRAGEGGCWGWPPLLRRFVLVLAAVPVPVPPPPPPRPRLRLRLGLAPLWSLPTISRPDGPLQCFRGCWPCRTYLPQPYRAQAKAIENELARTSGKALINFTVNGPRGAAPFGVKGFEGQSLKQASLGGWLTELRA